MILLQKPMAVSSETERLPVVLEPCASEGRKFGHLPRPISRRFDSVFSEKYLMVSTAGWRHSSLLARTGVASGG
jgi:hypothetical protein